MNALLRLLDRRLWRAAAVLAVAALLADVLGGYALGWLEARRDARERGASPLAGPIAAELEAKESARLRALHRRVRAEIAAARARGARVDRLQRAADAALRMDTPVMRDAALERLNRVRLAVPKGAQRLRPAAADEEDEP